MRIPTRSWLGLAALLTAACTVSEPVDPRDTSEDEVDDDREASEEGGQEARRDAGRPDAGGKKPDAGAKSDAGSRADGGADTDDAGSRDAGAAKPRDGGSSDGGSKPVDGGSLDAGKDAGSAEPPAPSGKCPSGGFCADFEDQTGATLSGAWSTVSPDCSGSGKITVQGDTVHGGKRALKIEGGGGYCDHVFAKPALPAGLLEGPVWVRFHVRFEEALGEGHTTFVAMRDESHKGDLRMGGQKTILMWNRAQPDDATLPALGPVGVAKSVAPVPKAWQCIEFHVDGASGTLETYANGKLVEALVIDGTSTPEIDSQWLKEGTLDWTAKLTDLRLGWEAYAGQRMTLFLDDVAVAATRPGC